jgi:hypothetical protein
MSTETPDEHLRSIVTEAIEEVTGQHQPSPPSTTEEKLLKLALLENCQRCQGDGGPLHAVVVELKSLTKTVADALTTLSERRGEKRVWAVLRFVWVPVCCVLLGWVLTHQADKRTDTMIQKQVDVAAVVAKQIEKVQAETTRELDQIKSASGVAVTK